MTITVNPAVLENLLTATFTSARLGDFSNYSVTSYVVFGGTRPAVTTSQGSAVALTALTAIPEGNWSPVSNNTIILAAPLSFVATATAQATFVRFFNDYAEPVFDISASDSAGPGVVVLDNLSCVSSVENFVTNLRFTFGASSTFRVNHAIAEFFLQYLSNPTTYPTYDSDSLVAASRMDPYNLIADKTVTVSAYSGVFPEAGIAVSDSDLDYSLLWEADLVEDDFFTVGGNIISLSASIPSVGLATGDPDFIQIRKAGFEGGYDPFPECVIHIAMSDAVTFSPSSIVESAPATLTSAAIIFGPEPEAVVPPPL